MDNDCKIFHLCVPVSYSGPRATESSKSGTASLMTMYSFLCANQTIFDQRKLVCTYPDESISCSQSVHYVSSNHRMQRFYGNKPRVQFPSSAYDRRHRNDKPLVRRQYQPRIVVKNNRVQLRLNSVSRRRFHKPPRTNPTPVQPNYSFRKQDGPRRRNEAAEAKYHPGSQKNFAYFKIQTENDHISSDIVQSEIHNSSVEHAKLGLFDTEALKELSGGQHESSVELDEPSLGTSSKSEIKTTLDSPNDNQSDPELETDIDKYYSNYDDFISDPEIEENYSFGDYGLVEYSASRSKHHDDFDNLGNLQNYSYENAADYSDSETQSNSHQGHPVSYYLNEREQDVAREIPRGSSSEVTELYNSTDGKSQHALKESKFFEFNLEALLTPDEAIIKSDGAKEPNLASNTSDAELSGTEQEQAIEDAPMNEDFEEQPGAYEEISWNPQILDLRSYQEVPSITPDNYDPYEIDSKIWERQKSAAESDQRADETFEQIPFGENKNILILNAYNDVFSKYNDSRDLELLKVGNSGSESSDDDIEKKPEVGTGEYAEEQLQNQELYPDSGEYRVQWIANDDYKDNLQTIYVGGFPVIRNSPGKNKTIEEEKFETESTDDQTSKFKADNETIEKIDKELGLYENPEGDILKVPSNDIAAEEIKVQKVDMPKSASLRLSRPEEELPDRSDKEALTKLFSPVTIQLRSLFELYRKKMQGV